MPIFMAAGNGATSSSHAVQYPASLSSVIAVGASNRDDVRASYSRWDSNLDIVGPSGRQEDAYASGSDPVRSTDRTGTAGYDSSDYSRFTGTSAATPFVAGVAALLLSYRPGMTTTQVRDALQDNAVEIDTAHVTYVGGRTDQYGHGRVDASAAFTGLTHDTAAPSGSSAVVSTVNGRRKIVIPFDERTVWEYDDVELSGPGGTVTGNEFRSGGYSLTGSGMTALTLLMPANADAGSYTITLKHGASGFRDQAGNAIGSNLSYSFSISAVTSAPDKPTSVALKSDPTSHQYDTGNGVTGTYADGITYNTTPTFTVTKASTGQAPTSVELKIVALDGQTTAPTYNRAPAGWAAAWRSRSRRPWRTGITRRRCGHETVRGTASRRPSDSRSGAGDRARPTRSMRPRIRVTSRSAGGSGI